MILFYDVISKSVTGIKMLPTLGEEFFAECKRESTFCCSICEMTRFNRRQNWMIKWIKESSIKEKKSSPKRGSHFRGSPSDEM